MTEIISGDRHVNVRTVRERAARAAAGLEALGVGYGDSVALMLRNDFAFFEASLAAGMLGAYPVPVNWHYTADEAGYVIDDCDAKALIVHADLLRDLGGALHDALTTLIVATPPEIAHAYAIPPDRCVPPPESKSWSLWLEAFEPLPSRDVAAPGTMIYSSGTTGRPKGVRRAPPEPAQAQAYQTMLLSVFGLKSGGTTVMTGPMYHSAPNAYGLASLALDCNTVLQSRFDPEALLALIERHRVTHMHMVPTMFVRLLKLPQAVRERYDLSSLEFVVHAAAPCPPDIKQRMIEWWGPVINEYYGATETGAVVFCTAEEWLAHPGTVGRPLPDADVRVLDAHGARLGVGETGEVAARLATTADFTYHGDEAKRAEADRSGLVAPGDVGYFDADGFLYISDRKKDMVISGGVNVYPAEIEGVLVDMSSVHDCAVFGIPDPEYGEALCAIVEPEPGTALTGDQVRVWLRERVAGYKVPKQIDFHLALPREDSGKIFKRKLREPYWAHAERNI